jgi:hypothetical protein
MELVCYFNKYVDARPDTELRAVTYSAFRISSSAVRGMKLKLIYDRQSVGQSVLVSDAHLGPVINFSSSSKFPSDSSVFVIL